MPFTSLVVQLLFYSILIILHRYYNLRYLCRKVQLTCSTSPLIFFPFLTKLKLLRMVLNNYCSEGEKSEYSVYIPPPLPSSRPLTAATYTFVSMDALVVIICMCALKLFRSHPQTTTDAVRAAACRLGAAATGPAHRRRTRPTARTAARTSTRRRPAWVAAAEAVTEAATRPIPVRTTGTAAIPVTTGPRCRTPRRPRRPFN